MFLYVLEAFPFIEREGFEPKFRFFQDHLPNFDQQFEQVIFQSSSLTEAFTQLHLNYLSTINLDQLIDDIQIAYHKMELSQLGATLSLLLAEPVNGERLRRILKKINESEQAVEQICHSFSGNPYVPFEWFIV